MEGRRRDRRWSPHLHRAGGSGRKAWPDLALRPHPRAVVRRCRHDGRQRLGHAVVHRPQPRDGLGADAARRHRAVRRPLLGIPPDAVRFFLQPHNSMKMPRCGSGPDRLRQSDKGQADCGKNATANAGGGEGSGACHSFALAAVIMRDTISLIPVKGLAGELLRESEW